MTDYPAIRNPNRCPTHPGELLDETVIPATGLTKAETARRLGISRQHLHGILEGDKPVTPPMALRLGKFYGNGPRLWLTMQATYDLWHAERETDTSAILPVTRALPA